MQVKITAKAYLPSWANISDVVSGRQVPLISNGEIGYFELQGCTLIGTAEVMIDLHADDKIMVAKLEALREQLRTVRAENQQRENAIMSQISKLRSINHTPKA